MATTSLTQDLVRAYANNESWKVDHIEAQLCCDFEEHLAWGVRLFEGLLTFEARMQDRVLRGGDPRLIDELESMPDLYNQWLNASERCLTVVKRFAEKGYAVDGLDTFEEAITQARWICESAAIEAEIRPYEEVLERLKPGNPDPSRYGD